MGDFYTIRNCIEFGNYIVSEKTFEEGEIVFKEEPLLSAPLEDREMIQQPELCCVGCYKIVPSYSETCSKCHFPVCSNSCSKDELHVKLECHILAENGIRPSQETFNFIKYLRVLLSKNAYPALYERFLLFASEVETGLRKFLFFAHRESLSVWGFLTEQCKLEVSLAEVKKIWTTLKINSFIMFTEDTTGIRYRGYALFDVCCRLNHSCSPNLEWFFWKRETEDGTVKWFMQIHATRKIEKGEILSIAYTSTELVYGTGFRREKCEESLPFYCRCSRCVDPTEEGTFFSSPKCPKCVLGYFVPEDPLSSLTSIWNCANCGSQKNGMDVAGAFTKCEKYISRFMNREPSSLAKLDSFIVKNSGKALHPNHYLIFQSTLHWLLESDWTEELAQQSEDSAKLLNKILSRFYRALPIVKKFLPTMTIVKLEDVVVTAIAAFAFKSDDSATINFSTTDRRWKFRYCKMILGHLSSANFWIQRQSSYMGWEEHKEVLSALYDTWARRFELYREDMLNHELDLEDKALWELRSIFE